jgi:hypothetical protein
MGIKSDVPILFVHLVLRRIFSPLGSSSYIELGMDMNLQTGALDSDIIKNVSGFSKSKRLLAIMGSRYCIYIFYNPIYAIILI